MAKIELSMPYLLANEGGFVVDDGGATRFGVTEPALSSFRGTPVTEDDIRNLTVMEATEVYRKEYWDQLGLDQIDNQNIATAIFDTSVNRGIAIGAKYAQRTYNTLNPMDTQLTEDGKLGPQSIDAINLCVQADFVRTFEGLVMTGYETLLAENPGKYGPYRVGWENRAKRLLSLI